MIEISLILEISIFVLIFIISSIIPIYLYIRFKFRSWMCSLISLGLALLFMNLDFSSLPISKSGTGELYEVFWLIPPVFVGIVTCCLAKRTKKGKVKKKT